MLSCIICKRILLGDAPLWAFGEDSYICSRCRNSIKIQKGGFRPGSGRKKMAEDVKKVRRTFTLSPDALSFLSDLSVFKNKSVSQVLNDLILSKK